MLKNLTAAVTGAGSGIGKETAKALARHGAYVIVNDLYPEAANRVVEEILKEGGQAYAWPHDVSKEDTIESLTDTVRKTTNQLHILVNSAGGGPGLMSKFLEITPSEWTSQLNINLSSAFYCSKAAVPFMLESKYGRIINISSTAALRGGGLKGTTGYSSAKAGLLGLTKTLAREFATQGICVNAIAPAYHETPMHDDLDIVQKQAMAANIPMKASGDPADLAEFISFLASKHSKFMTGSVIPVDGGFTMH